MNVKIHHCHMNYLKLDYSIFFSFKFVSSKCYLQKVTPQKSWSPFSPFWNPMYKLIPSTFANFVYFFTLIFCTFFHFVVMVDAISLTRSRPSLTMVYGVTYIQQRMLGGCFERFIVNRYGFYDVPRNDLKYINYDLINAFRHLTITYCWVLVIRMGLSKMIEQIDIFLTGVITIKQAKKCVKRQGKAIKIGKMFMFYCLKPWQSWQIVPFSYI